MRILTLSLMSALLIVAPVFTMPQEPQPQEQAPVQAEQAQPAEVSGKIKSVDATASTIELEGVDQKIVVTSSTKFADGLSLASLKEGMSVKVAGKALADGRIEALEVKNA